jgi:hypothetical protein
LTALAADRAVAEARCPYIAYAAANFNSHAQGERNQCSESLCSAADAPKRNRHGCI